MFEGVADEALIASIAESTRREAIVGAQRLAAIAELIARRVDPNADERACWVIDDWEELAAEISAALRITARKASGLMYQAQALRERLPQVAAVYARGEISSAMVSTITWRTKLVDDPAAVAAIDAGLAAAATEWGPLAAHELEAAVDAVVHRHDPEGVRRTRTMARDRDVRTGKPDDATGTASLWGRLLGPDAALLQARLAQMIAGVCGDDPRTVGQRRADALGALAAGADRLACRCANPDCPAAGADARAASVVVHVIAEQDALDDQPDPHMSGEAHVPLEAPGRNTGMAMTLQGTVIPSPLLADLIAHGATVTTVAAPQGGEPRYRPSAGLARFVAMRDMTCTFPGCNRSAQHCDVDHTVPYPAGPTHPSNTKLLCRVHHLVKTFAGWRDDQAPDGAVTWTAPSGHTYRTHPGSRMPFARWDTTTADLPPPPQRLPEHPDRTAMMPRRRRTRAAEQRQRIKAERAVNAAEIAGERPDF